MTDKNQGLIPGFIGEAIRNSNIESIKKPEDLGTDTNPLKNNKIQMDNLNDALNVAIAENAAIHSGTGVVVTPEIIELLKNQSEMNMENQEQHADAMNESAMVTATQSKVISGKNGEELETRINQFLASNPNIDITNTDFGTAVGGVYYTILYRTRIERV